MPAGKFATSAWPRSRGSTPTAPRRCGTVWRTSAAAAAGNGAQGETKAESDSEDGGAIWEVLDLGDPGLVVYERKGTGWLIAGRLTVGARLQELAVEGDFFSYQKLFGDGPAVGWVRMRLASGTQSIQRLACIERRDEEDEDDDEKDDRPQAKSVLSVANVSSSYLEVRAVAGATGKEAAEDGDSPDPLSGKLVWIAALGPRGDMQPCVALGVQLQRAGCAVRLFGPSAYGKFALAYGLAFTAIAEGGFDDFWNRSQDLWHLHTVQVFQLWVEQELCSAHRILLSKLKAKQPGLLIVHSTCINAAAVASKTYGVPVAQLHFKTHPFPGDVKYQWPTFVDFCCIERAGVDQPSKEGGAAPVAPTSFAEWCAFHDTMPRLVAGSSMVLTTERDERILKQADSLAYVGNLVLEDQQPSADPWFFGSSNEFRKVQTFLMKSSATTVYVGFGGRVCGKGGAHMLCITGLALASCGMRGIFVTGGCSGWTFEDLVGSIYTVQAMGHIPATDAARYTEFLLKNIIFVEAAPHEWLFKRCACTLHHGGQSTTAAALRSGTPTIVVPLKDDHRAGAHLVNTLGVGVGFLDVQWDDLLPQPLVGALHIVTQETKIRAKAREVGRAIRKEDGCGAALVQLRAVMRLERRRAAPAAAPEAGEVEDQPGEASAPSRKAEEPEKGAAKVTKEDQSATAVVWVITHESGYQQCMVALAVALQRSGLKVKLLGGRCVQECALHAGLDFVQICEGPDEFIGSPDVAECMSNDTHERRGAIIGDWWVKEATSATRRVLDLMEREGPPNLLVVQRYLFGIGLVARRKYKVALLRWYYQAPFEPNWWQPHPVFDMVPLAVAGIGPSWPESEEWQAVVSQQLTLVSLPSLVFDGAFPEGEARRFASMFRWTGFWALGHEFTCSHEDEDRLTQFSASGQPMVFIAMCETMCFDSSWMSYVLFTAARFAGLRAVVMEGFAQVDLENLRRGYKKYEDPFMVQSYCEANTLVVKGCPPASFLRRCACAVHCGGPTVTGILMHAGLPSLVCPFHDEHFFWARIIQDCGIAKNLGDLRQMTPELLTLGMRDAASNEQMRASATHIAAMVAADEGVEGAVHMVREQLEAARSGVG